MQTICSHAHHIICHSAHSTQTLQWPITSNTDFLIIFLTINPNPPFLNFLCGRKPKLELGENPQFLAEC